MAASALNQKVDSKLIPNVVTQIFSQCQLSKLAKLVELWWFTVVKGLTQFLQACTPYIIFISNPVISAAALIFENHCIFMISQRISLIHQASRGIFEEMKYLELMIVNDHKMVSISIQWFLLIIICRVIYSTVHYTYFWVKDLIYEQLLMIIL